MSKIPPELENTMWALAESGNPQAVSEFEARYPGLKIELAKRTAMVRNLRSHRPDNVTTPAIPRFVPGPTADPGPSRGMYLGAFVCATVALSVFAYTAVVARHRKPVELPAPTPVVETQVVPPSAPVVVHQPDTFNLRELPQPTQNPPRSLRDEPPILAAPETHSWQRPQSLTMRDVPLRTVLDAVADEGKLSLDVAPGMPNPTITVDYQDTSAEDILKDLGRIYAFTPILSDDGSAIMVPAVARVNPSEPSGLTRHVVGKGPAP